MLKNQLAMNIEHPDGRTSEKHIKIYYVCFWKISTVNPCCPNQPKLEPPIPAKSPSSGDKKSLDFDLKS